MWPNDYFQWKNNSSPDPNLNSKTNPNAKNILTENSELGPLLSVNFMEDIIVIYLLD